MKGDVREAGLVRDLVSDADAVMHAAAQAAVTTSLADPRTDFDVNAIGTFNVLEAARQSQRRPSVILAGTNKVYGGNVNGIPVRTVGDRYEFSDARHRLGIPETLAVDHCNTPRTALPSSPRTFMPRNTRKPTAYERACSGCLASTAHANSAKKTRAGWPISPSTSSGGGPSESTRTPSRSGTSCSSAIS